MRLAVLPLFAILAIPALAQEAGEPETEAAQTPSAESAETVEDGTEESDADEEILDDFYSDEEEDDDKFIPSEDVAFGQSIPFPTDI